MDRLGRVQRIPERYLIGIETAVICAEPQTYGRRVGCIGRRRCQHRVARGEDADGAEVFSDGVRERRKADDLDIGARCYKVQPRQSCRQEDIVKGGLGVKIGLVVASSASKAIKKDAIGCVVT